MKHISFEKLSSLLIKLLGLFLNIVALFNLIYGISSKGDNGKIIGLDAILVAVCLATTIMVLQLNERTETMRNIFNSLQQLAVNAKLYTIRYILAYRLMTENEKANIGEVRLRPSKLHISHAKFSFSIVPNEGKAPNIFNIEYNHEFKIKKLKKKTVFDLLISHCDGKELEVFCYNSGNKKMSIRPLRVQTNETETLGFNGLDKVTISLEPEGKKDIPFSINYKLEDAYNSEQGEVLLVFPLVYARKIDSIEIQMSFLKTNPYSVSLYSTPFSGEKGVYEKVEDFQCNGEGKYSITINPCDSSRIYFVVNENKPYAAM